MDAILPLQSTPRRSRRKHSPEFKSAVLAACHQPGVSVAAIARQYDLNDNIVHKWLADARRSTDPESSSLTNSRDVSPASPALTFIPIQIADTPTPASAPIRLHLRQGQRDLSVEWPADQAQACLALIQALLR
ncbi:transposase [Iodobacter fluviatilis]|jgi:transposase|uniref:Transposase n=2 Tax=Iodobacter fluviatilis TaxID=537 RepID=A0A377QAH1_9NEIS|nr:transposase [Iodobacter fluviatilis]STQ90176.1 Transposase [Iodobacter fluviatilis]STQ90206.1 Transposase [Iodobacter fluviatilis]STQ91923.1 Transposase [Iodobacter fluviatilis]